MNNNNVRNCAKFWCQSQFLTIEQPDPSLTDFLRDKVGTVSITVGVIK